MNGVGEGRNGVVVAAGGERRRVGGGSRDVGWGEEVGTLQQNRCLRGCTFVLI